jgi:hypothetical protein
MALFQAAQQLPDSKAPKLLPARAAPGCSRRGRVLQTVEQTDPPGQLQPHRADAVTLASGMPHLRSRFGRQWNSRSSSKRVRAGGGAEAALRAGLVPSSVIAGRLGADSGLATVSRPTLETVIRREGARLDGLAIATIYRYGRAVMIPAPIFDQEVPNRDCRS